MPLPTMAPLNTVLVEAFCAVLCLDPRALGSFFFFLNLDGSLCAFYQLSVHGQLGILQED
jgi:hypothetical protein